jgi:hypothetical protein
MRVTTDLWAAALVRRVFASGGFAAIMQRGAPEAGAAFVMVRKRTGEVSLFAPAPQSSYDSAKPDDRFFSPLGEGEDPEALDKRIERERRFDPDIWVIEIETGSVPLEDLISVRR